MRVVNWLVTEAIAPGLQALNDEVDGDGREERHAENQGQNVGHLLEREIDRIGLAAVGYPRLPPRSPTAVTSANVTRAATHRTSMLSFLQLRVCSSRATRH